MSVVRLIESADPYAEATSFPWEKREEETDKNYSAFLIYKNLGIRRSLRKAAAEYYEVDLNAPTIKSQTVVLERWSRQFQWVMRATAWDRYMQDVAEAEEIDAVRLMTKRHTNLSLHMQKVAQERITALDADKLSVSDATKLAVEGVRIERLSRGVATDHGEFARSNDSAPVREYDPMSTEGLEERLEALIAGGLARDDAQPPPGEPENGAAADS